MHSFDFSGFVRIRFLAIMATFYLMCFLVLLTIILPITVLASPAVNIVIVSDTGSQFVIPNSFTFLDEAVINSLSVIFTRSNSSFHSADFGQVGTTVIISGSHLLGGGTSITDVTLAWAPVLSIVSFNDSAVIVRADAPNPAMMLPLTGDVVITSNSGAISVKPNVWTYRVKGHIESIRPIAGQQGTLVTIAGTNLRGYGAHVSRVFLGLTAATIIFQDDTRVVVKAGTSGQVGHVLPTMYSDTDAIIEGDDKQQKKYRAGDEMPNSIILQSIAKDQVILLRNQQAEYLSMDRTKLSDYN